MQHLPIPHDIIGDIIDHLPYDSRSLIQLTRVGRSFRAQCQKRLFSTISLRCAAPQRVQQRFRRLVNLFTTNPDLATYVRELYIVDDDEDDGWVTKSRSLPHFLRCLPHLRSFSLVFRYLNHVEWASLTPSLRASILNIFASRDLLTLNLTNLCFGGFPITSFGASHRLRKLGIVSCAHIVHSNYSTEEPLLPLTRTYDAATYLESLEIGGSISSRVVEVLTNPQSWVSISSLRELSIQTSTPETLRAACAVIETAAKTIESLIWTFPADSTGQIPFLHKPDVGSFGPINLKLLTNLRHLLLGITSEMGDISCSPQLSWLTHALRYDYIPQSLEELTIVLVSTRFGVLAGTSWPRLHQTCIALRKVGLDSILSDNERYPKLRKVTILIDASGKLDEDKESDSFLSTNLPLLSREGMLRTGFCDIHDIFVKSTFVTSK